MPDTVDLRSYHGDTWSHAFVLADGGLPVDLAGCTVEAWAVAIGDPVALLVSVGPAPGEVTLRLPAGLGPGVYVYDVEVVDTAATVRTWYRGRLIVERDVTNRAS